MTISTRRFCASLTTAMPIALLMAVSGLRLGAVAATSQPATPTPEDSATATTAQMESDGQIPWGALLRQQMPGGDLLPPEHGDDFLDLTNGEQLASTLHRSGTTIPQLYRTLSYDQRSDLIAGLNSAAMLRDHLVEFLSWEPRSSVRALLLQSVDPLDFARPEIAGPDVELVALLDLPTATPIGIQEWVARMELASRIDPEFGAEWVRAAEIAFPDSADIQFVRSIIILTDGWSGDLYSASENEAATKALVGLLENRHARRLTPESRIRAYYALYFSPDRGAAREFFRRQRDAESDPRARDILELLQLRLERLNGGGP